MDFFDGKCEQTFGFNKHQTACDNKQGSVKDPDDLLLWAKCYILKRHKTCAL